MNFGPSHDDLKKVDDNSAIDYLTLITLLRDKGIATVQEIATARAKATVLLEQASEEDAEHRMQTVRAINQDVYERLQKARVDARS